MSTSDTVPQAASNISWREFFADRSWEIPPTEDHMRPYREALTPDEVDEAMLLWLTKGDYTSTILKDRTFPLSSCDGCSLLSPTHTRCYSQGSFTNIISGAPALSRHAFTAALRQAQQNGIAVPDTLIVGGHESMYQKAQEIQKTMHDIFHWNIDICFVSALKEMPLRYHWYLASRKNSGMHLKNCGHGYFELCALRWDWIIASLSVTQPINF